MTEKDLMQLKNMLSLAHHTPGRARIKGSMALLGLSATKELMNLAKGKKTGSIASFSVNPLARSVTVSYDTEQLAPRLIDEFFRTQDPQRAGELANTIAQLFGIELQLKEGE